MTVGTAVDNGVPSNVGAVVVVGMPAFGQASGVGVANVGAIVSLPSLLVMAGMNHMFPPGSNGWQLANETSTFLLQSKDIDVPSALQNDATQSMPP